jgi:SAM-dependent methyltransferase
LQRKLNTPPWAADYSEVNRLGWARLVHDGCGSSHPFGPTEFAQARSMLDPTGRLPWNEIRSVLCLAAAGGQQAPLFASLGYEVVSADLCLDQLRKDQAVALQHGFAIECIEADMMDLSSLYGCGFDLVFQAVSACYIPNARQLYREVSKVLRREGLYRVEHWNPLHLQLAEHDSWNGRAYQIERPLETGVPIPWHGPSFGQPLCLHFMHSLEDLIGGLCAAGFSIIDFYSRYAGNLDAPPGSHEHLASFIPPFFTILGRSAAALGKGR